MAFSNHKSLQEIESNYGNSNDFQIKTFEEIEDVQNLQNFIKDNPINNDNYECIIGDYVFDYEVQCCKQKDNGNLCKQNHKYGFVAKLKDNTITIVGNNCATNNFGVDAKIKADSNKYKIEKKRLQSHQEIEKLIEQKQLNLDKVEDFKNKLKKLQESVNKFYSELGEQTQQQLQALTKLDIPTIYIEKSREHRERVTNFNGVKIFREYYFKTIFNEINNYHNAYLAAEQVQPTANVNELGPIIKTLKEIKTISDGYHKLEKQKETFFKNDLIWLCFFSNNKNERYQTARAIKNYPGEQIGKDKAKQWLIEREGQLKKLYDVKTIYITF